MSEVIVSKIKAFDEELFLVCDGKCNKAWGINARPSVQLSDDEDDTAYLADSELGEAPADPGTYEGGHAKPRTPKHNKWCYRECERSDTSPINELPKLQSFESRVYNMPWKHEEVKQ